MSGSMGAQDWVGRQFEIRARDNEAWMEFLRGYCDGFDELAQQFQLEVGRQFTVLEADVEDQAEDDPVPILRIDVPRISLGGWVSIADQVFEDFVQQGYFQEIKAQHDHAGMIQNPLTGVWGWL
jgi:hypothetical protein